jgi:hypothetical protein
MVTFLAVATVSSCLHRYSPRHDLCYIKLYLPLVSATLRCWSYINSYISFSYSERKQHGFCICTSLPIILSCFSMFTSDITVPYYYGVDDKY